jgi:hypothetical protein
MFVKKFVLKTGKQMEGIAPERWAFLRGCRDACHSAFKNVDACKEDANAKACELEGMNWQHMALSIDHKMKTRNITQG